MKLKAIDLYRSLSSSQRRQQLVQSDCAFLGLGPALIFFLTAVLPAFGGRMAYAATLAQPTQSTSSAISGNKVPFTTIAKGYRSGVNRALEIAVRNQPDWISLWKKHAAVERTPPAPPTIDFKDEIVAAVFLGTRTTGGFDIEIVGAELTANKLILSYRDRRPGPGDMTTQTIIQPFHMVQIAAMGVQTVDFRRLS